MSAIERPSPRIVVVGSVNIDQVMRVARLPRSGETVSALTFTRLSGGKGANQAVAAARLGAHVDFVGRIGYDDKAMLDELQAESIGTDHVVLDRENATGTAMINVADNGEKTIVVNPGANGAMTREDIDAAIALLERADAIVVQLEIPMDVVVHAIEVARALGVRTFLDAAPATALSDHLLSMTDVLRMNSHEAVVVSGCDCTNREQAHHAIDKLLRRGVGMVAVQAGDEGNLIGSAGIEEWFPLVDVPCVDATGAGDALTAALAVRLAEGGSLREAGEFASCAAALATTGAGARGPLPLRAAVEALVVRERGASAV